MNGPQSVCHHCNCIAPSWKRFSFSCPLIFGSKKLCDWMLSFSIDKYFSIWAVGWYIYLTFKIRVRVRTTQCTYCFLHWTFVHLIKCTKEWPEFSSVVRFSQSQSWGIFFANENDETLRNPPLLFIVSCQSNVTVIHRRKKEDPKSPEMAEGKSLVLFNVYILFLCSEYWVL